MVALPWQLRRSPGRRRTAPSSRISSASRQDATTTITAAFQSPRLRGKRNRKPYITTTTSAPVSDDQVDDHEEDKPTNSGEDQGTSTLDENPIPTDQEEAAAVENLPEDPVVSRLMTTVVPASGKPTIPPPTSSSLLNPEHHQSTDSELDDSRPVHIPDIVSIFNDNPAVSRKDPVFEGLATREIARSSSRVSVSEMRAEHRDSADYQDLPADTESPNNGLEDAHTIGPYDSVPDYVNDQPDVALEGAMMKDQDDDSSTILPEAEPAYRYNIKVRTNGKVLDPPSK